MIHASIMYDYAADMKWNEWVPLAFIISYGTLEARKVNNSDSISLYFKWINFRVDKISQNFASFSPNFSHFSRGFSKNCNFKNFAWTKFREKAKIRDNREN